MISFTVPGKPFGKQRPRVARGHAYTPKETVSYEAAVRKAYTAKYEGEPLDGPVAVKIDAYYPIPKSTTKKRRAEIAGGLVRPTVTPDIDNIGKIITDALNGLAYHDDSQIVRLEIEKWYSEEPRCEVLIRMVK